MTITAIDVKNLREKTGAGMMDCKKALTESAGDIEKAIEFLRKKGLATAAKRAGKAASEGIIGNILNADSTDGVLVEINCETDFVAKTADFQNFVSQVSKLIAAEKPADTDALLGLQLENTTVKANLTELIGKVGENLSIRRFANFTASNSNKVGQYIHAGGKIGVMVEFTDSNNKLDAETAKDVAMHIAAMNPQFTKQEDVPSEVIAKEKEIQKEQFAGQNKPAEVIEKIVTGRLSKFYSEVCLNDQAYVKDSSGKTSVAKALQAIDAEIKIINFARFQVGEKTD